MVRPLLMLTYSEERALMDDIKEGIEIALHARGATADPIDDIKVNKIAYLAIQEFDLDITYGWFKYGPAPVDTASRGSGNAGPSSDISAAPPGEITASDYSRVPSEEQDHPSPERYTKWLVESEEFDCMLEMETKIYLEHFYEEYAPEAYRSLYLACIRLQQHLDDLDTDRTGDGLSQIDDAYHSELSKLLNEVYGELLKRPQLDESVEPFDAYKRLLKNIVATAASVDDHQVEQRVRFIEEVIDFFFTDTWRYVALLISKDTVRGANADRLRNNIDSDLADLRHQYQEAIEELEERSELFGLQSTSKRVTDEHEDPARRDHERKPQTENLEEWERLAGEVINE